MSNGTVKFGGSIGGGHCLSSTQVVESFENVWEMWHEEPNRSLRSPENFQM